MENKEITKIDKKTEWANKLQEAIPETIFSSYSKEKVNKVFAGILISAQKNPQIFKCTPESILISAYNCLEFEMLSGNRNECALIPRKNKDSQNLELHFQPMVYGIINTAYDSGAIIKIDCEVICENDFFEYEQGSEIKLTFKKQLFDERGKILGAYCVAKLPNGQQVIEVMNVKELEKIRKKAQTDYVWRDNLEEMYRKTVVKRVFKRLPKKGEKLEKIIEIDNSLERPDISEPDNSKATGIMARFGMNELPEPEKQEEFPETNEPEKVLATLEEDDVPDDFYDLASDPNFLNEQPKRGK
jgi:recombination protein RecT